MVPEFEMLKRVSKKSGRPVSFTLAQTLDSPDNWKDGVRMLKEANAEGIRMKGQVIGRPTGFMLGHDLSYTPFSLRPTYAALAELPLEQKIAELRKPEVRAKILSETDGVAKYTGLKFLSWFDRMFVLGDPPDYAQPLDKNIPSLAAKKGVSAAEYAYDAMLEGDGTKLLFMALGNYCDGTMDPVEAMLKDENTILGLGDGGAHYGMICDAGYPTHLLTYWGRDVAAEKRIALPALIKKLSSETAAAVDLLDRGVVKPGYKGDLNIIDFKNLTLRAPHSVRDLPANGRRMKQNAEGFIATIVNGEVTYRNGQHTGKLPGKLVRGAKKAPGGMQAAAE
jgi:N-acyl-D-aspartate/D-glutamate deacylase